MGELRRFYQLWNPSLLKYEEVTVEHVLPRGNRLHQSQEDFINRFNWLFFLPLCFSANVKQKLFFCLIFVAMIAGFVVFFILLKSTHLDSNETHGHIHKPSTVLFVFLPYFLMWLEPIFFLYMLIYVGAQRFMSFPDPVDQEIERLDRNIISFNDRLCQEFVCFKWSVLAAFLCNLLIKGVVEYIRFRKSYTMFFYIHSIFWPILLFFFIIANGMLILAAKSCKIHILVFKEQMRRTKSRLGFVRVLEHYIRVRDCLKKFGSRISWCFAIHVVISTFSLFSALTAAYVALLVKKSLSIATGDNYLCLCVAQVAFLWIMLWVLKDLTIEFENIVEVAADEVFKAKTTVNPNPALISHWEALAQYISYSGGGGVYVFSRKIDSSFFDILFGTQFCLGSVVIGAALPLLVKSMEADTRIDSLIAVLRRLTQ